MGFRILGTLFNRALTAILNFLIVVITARYLGADGRGEISLLLLAVTIIQVLSGIMGGGALVYLAPRYALSKLFIVSMLWAFIISTAASVLFAYFHLIQGYLLWPVFILSLIVSLLANVQSLQLAKQKFTAFNLTSVAQPLLLFCTFIYLINKQTITGIQPYIYASYVAYGLPLFVSLFFISAGSTIQSSWKEVIAKFINHGGWGQMANLAQLLNYRFSYYCVEWLKGTAALGVFSTGVSVGESVWVFSKSISTVKYANNSNNNDMAQMQKQCLLLMKFSIIGTCALVLILCSIPDSVYLSLFGKDFSGIHWLLVLLSPGIILLSGYTILAAYFSGTGRHHIAFKASGIGLVVTISSALLLIPYFGLAGAAIAANLSHAANGLFLFHCFRKETTISWLQLMPMKQDVKALKEVLKKF